MASAALKCTDKQAKFAEAYVGAARFNALKAAEMAGYKSACVSAVECVKHPAVIEYIQELIGPEIEKVKVSAAKLVDEIEGIAYANITDILDMDEAGNIKLRGKLSDLPKHVQAAIKSISVREVNTEHGVNRHFNISMHSKTEMIKLLTLIHKLIDAPAAGAVGFTGLTLVGPNDGGDDK